MGRSRRDAGGPPGPAAGARRRARGASDHRPRGLADLAQVVVRHSRSRRGRADEPGPDREGDGHADLRPVGVAGHPDPQEPRSARGTRTGHDRPQGRTQAGPEGVRADVQREVVPRRRRPHPAVPLRCDGGHRRHATAGPPAVRGCRFPPAGSPVHQVRLHRQVLGGGTGPQGAGSQPGDAAGRRDRL
jgi:hypothetical protein